MKTLSVFLLLLFTAPAFNGIKAQQSKTVSLHDAIQLALDNNLNVRSSAYSVDAQKALKGASWDLEKTSVQMQYGKFNSYTKDNSFTVSQSIAFPTVYINQSKLADAKVKSSEWQLKGSRLETATMVKQVYWQLAFLHSKQRLLSYQDSLYTGFLKAAELRTKVGETNKLEMITARSQSMEIKNQLRQTVADMDILKRKLQTLLNTDVLYSPADTILKRIEYTLITDSMAVAQNPSLGYMQQQTQVSQIERKLEKSKMLPDFSIGYSSQTMVGTQDVNGISRAFGRGDRFNSVQVGVAVPLWFVSGNSKNKAAKISEKIAKTNAESYSKELSGSYRSLLDEYSKYSGSVDYYEKQAIPEANLIIDQSTRSYKSGAMDYFEYVLSLGRALDIKQNYLDALNSYNQTIINIEFITGKIF